MATNHDGGPECYVITHTLPAGYFAEPFQISSDNIWAINAVIWDGGGGKYRCTLFDSLAGSPASTFVLAICTLYTGPQSSKLFN